MKRITILTLLLALCSVFSFQLSAQDPNLHYFGIKNGSIFWERNFDGYLTQKQLVAILKTADSSLLKNVASAGPGTITAKVPMHAVQYDCPGIRPEQAEILLTGAQVSGDVVISLYNGGYTVRVNHLVLKMSRPSTEYGISGTHPFEYHFRRTGSIIKNTLFNTYLAAALDYELDHLFESNNY